MVGIAIIYWTIAILIIAVITYLYVKGILEYVQQLERVISVQQRQIETLTQYKIKK